MNFFDTLQSATSQERQALFSVPVIRDALNGVVSLEGYTAFLAQAYHHVRHTVPLMMACGARLPSRLEWLRGAVCEYIEEEYGHEQWILNDIAACSADPERVRNSRPALPIELMVAFLYDLIARDNPVGLFGMVNVLEGTSIALATQAAGSIQQGLGLPPTAFSYLSSHGALRSGPHGDVPRADEPPGQSRRPRSGDSFRQGRLSVIQRDVPGSAASPPSGGATCACVSWQWS